MAVDGLTFLSRLRPRGCGGRWLTAEDHGTYTWFAGLTMVDLCLQREWRFPLMRSHDAHTSNPLGVMDTVHQKLMSQLRAKERDSLVPQRPRGLRAAIFNDVTHTFSSACSCVCTLQTQAPHSALVPFTQP